jgi:hypothetical protein
MTYIGEPAWGNAVDVHFSVDKNSKRGGKSRGAE